jgi:predicted nucleotide-binding protein
MTRRGGLTAKRDGSQPAEPVIPDPRKVFVIHGRNTAARDAVFAYLNALGLKPIEWREAVALTGSGAPTTREIVEAGMRAAQAVVGVLTGDDEVHLRPEFHKSSGEMSHELNSTRQARPNVLFELGMAFAFHPKRVMLVQIGPDLRPASDLIGIDVVTCDDARAVRKLREALRDRLKDAKCTVRRQKSHLRVGNFAKALQRSVSAEPTSVVHKSYVLCELPISRTEKGKIRAQVEQIRQEAFEFLRKKNRKLENDHVRANVFLPDYREAKSGHGHVFELRMDPRLTVNMLRSEERPRLPPRCGATGWAFEERDRHITRDPLFNLPEKQRPFFEGKKDPRWIVSEPLKTDKDQVFGVFNLDGLKHSFDDRVLGRMAEQLSEKVQALADQLANQPRVTVDVVEYPSSANGTPTSGTPAPARRAGSRRRARAARLPR